MVPLRDAGQIRGGQHPDLRRPLSPVHHLPGSTHLSRPFLLPNRRWSARRFRHGLVSPSCTCVALPALLPSHCPHFEGKQRWERHGTWLSHFPVLTFRSAQQLFISMLMPRCTSVTIWHAQTAHAHAVHVLVQIWAAVVEVAAGMPYNCRY